MGFIEGVYLKMRSIVSYFIAMLQSMVAILDQIKRLQKYFKQTSISPRSLRTQGDLS